MALGPLLWDNAGTHCYCATVLHVYKRQPVTNLSFFGWVEGYIIAEIIFELDVTRDNTNLRSKDMHVANPMLTYINHVNIEEIEN